MVLFEGFLISAVSQWIAGVSPYVVDVVVIIVGLFLSGQLMVVGFIEFFELAGVFLGLGKVRPLLGSLVVREQSVEV